MLPTRLAPGKVLITGLNGFVAVHVASLFVSKGWAVRGTVRSPAKRERVLSFPALQEGVKAGQIEVVIVEDFLASDWSEALDGVDAVVHAATPFDLTLKTYEDFSNPAIKGTKRLLEAAAKVETIKAVAYVSSIVAVYDLFVPFTSHEGKTLTEQDWYRLTEEDASKEGSGPAQWYCLSKKYGELAARETHKTLGARYALSSYCAPGIYGPPEHILSASELGAAPGTDLSASQLYGLLRGGEDGVLLPEYNVIYVDVRDLASALYSGVVTRATGRYLVGTDTITSQKTVNAARAVRPDLAKFIVKGQPGENDDVPEYAYKVDVSKSKEELGVHYRTIQDTVRDTMAKFEALGVYG